MVRVALLLLAMPSLLMPPGVCVCQYARTDRVTPDARPVASPRTASVVAGEGAARAGGCCKRCRGTTNTAPHSRPPDGPVEPAPRPPADREHAPNCPAVTPTVALKLADLSVLPPELLFSAGGWLVDDVAVPTVTRVAPTDTPFPPTPRYITFRSLLI